MVPSAGYRAGEGKSPASVFHLWPAKPGTVGDAPCEHHRAHRAVSCRGLRQGQLGSGRLGRWQGHWNWKGRPPSPSSKGPLCLEAHRDHCGREASASPRWALLPWSSDPERPGFSLGAIWRVRVGPGPTALLSEGQSVMHCFFTTQPLGC